MKISSLTRHRSMSTHLTRGRVGEVHAARLRGEDQSPSHPAGGGWVLEGSRSPTGQAWPAFCSERWGGSRFGLSLF